MDVATYATEIGNKWGVGQSDFKNGIVILVKPTGGAGRRDLFIAVGYGLEGAIPDLLTKQIRENDIEPYFKKGKYSIGLENGLKSLFRLTNHAYNFKYGNNENTNFIDNFYYWLFSLKGTAIVIYYEYYECFDNLFIIIGIFIFIFIASKLSKNSGGRTYYSRGITNYRGGSGYTGGGRGYSGGGSYGGGSFGGGGSGGKW